MEVSKQLYQKFLLTFQQVLSTYLFPPPTQCVPFKPFFAFLLELVTFPHLNTFYMVAIKSISSPVFHLLIFLSVLPYFGIDVPQNSTVPLPTPAPTRQQFIIFLCDSCHLPSCFPCHEAHTLAVLATLMLLSFHLLLLDKLISLFNLVLH